MARVQMLLLAFAFMSAVCAAQTSGAKETGGEATVERADGAQRREAMQKERLENLLAPFDIKVARAGTVARTSATRSYRQVRVRWENDEKTAPASDVQQAATEAPAQGALSVVGERILDGRLTMQRSLEMSPEQVLVVAVDAATQLRWWTLVADPRILRSESLMEGNQLRGRILYRASADFFVDVPDDAEITELRFYKPTEGVGALTLQPLGTIVF